MELGDELPQSDNEYEIDDNGCDGNDIDDSDLSDNEVVEIKSQIISLRAKELIKLKIKSSHTFTN